MKPGTIIYYLDTYWRVVRIGYDRGEEVFFEYQEWWPKTQNWINGNTILSHPHQGMRIPGRLEVLVTLGVKANGQY